MNNIDPSTLKVHPQRSKHITWTEDDPRYLALVDDISARGLQQPILITAANQVVDGVLRWRAAKRLQLKQVPAIVIADDQVNLTIVQTLIQRRHYTKGALTYICQPLVEEAHFQAQKLSRQETPFRGGNSIDTMLQRFGFSAESYRQASELHEIFEERAEFKTQLEPGLLAGEAGLGATYAAAKAMMRPGPHGGGRPQATEKQLDLFTDGLSTLKTRYEYWNHFDLQQREKVVVQIRDAVQAMPPDLRHEWKRAINQAERANKD